MNKSSLMVFVAALAVPVGPVAAQEEAAQQLQIVPAEKPGLATPPEGWAYLPELAIFGPAEIYHRQLATPGDAAR